MSNTPSDRHIRAQKSYGKLCAQCGRRKTPYTRSDASRTEIYPPIVLVYAFLVIAFIIVVFLSQGVSR